MWLGKIHPLLPPATSPLEITTLYLGRGHPHSKGLSSRRSFPPGFQFALFLGHVNWQLKLLVFSPREASPHSSILFSPGNAHKLHAFLHTCTKRRFIAVVGGKMRKKVPLFGTLRLQGKSSRPLIHNSDYWDFYLQRPVLQIAHSPSYCSSFPDQSLPNMQQVCPLKCII